MHYNIVVVSGLDRVGKSSFGRCLSLNGANLFECGEYVRKSAIHEMPLNSSVSEYYALNMDRYNCEIVSNIKSRLGNKSEFLYLVVVGVRSISLLEAIFELNQNTFIVYVQSEFSNRFNRLLDDREKNSLPTIKEFMINDELQYSWGIDSIKEKADEIVLNDSDYEAFIKSAKSLKERICQMCLT